MQFLLLIYGLPGSGKSTFAKSVIENNPGISHYEADMFHIDKNGVYKFDITKQQLAHEWCQDKVREDLQAGKSVIVSNTSLTRCERMIYFEMSKNLNIPIKVKYMSNNFGNIHNVPKETLERMRSRFQLINEDEINHYNLELM